MTLGGNSCIPLKPWSGSSFLELFDLFEDFFPRWGAAVGDMREEIRQGRSFHRWLSEFLILQLRRSSPIRLNCLQYFQYFVEYVVTIATQQINHASSSSGTAASKTSGATRTAYPAFQ